MSGFFAPNKYCFNGFGSSETLEPGKATYLHARDRTTSEIGAPRARRKEVNNA